MSNTVPSVNLQTAVLMQVQEFTTANRSFSRYEITTALREKCNSGTLEIPELENTNPGSQYRYLINKSDVDSIFEQLFNNCLANGLPPLTVSFDRTKGYRVFSVDANALAGAANATLTSAGSVIPAPSYSPVPSPLATSPGSTPGNPVQTNPSAKFAALASLAAAAPTNVPPSAPSTTPSVVPLTPLTDSELRRRVTQYMQGCQKLGKIPTLKQVQSAIKRGTHSTGLSYREITNLTKSLGFAVANPV